MDYSEYLPKRLTLLRLQKGVSARDMSLSLGQSPSYVNMIENRRALPSMQMFFEICEFLEVTPMAFFDHEEPIPAAALRLQKRLERLGAKGVDSLSAFIDFVLPETEPQEPQQP